MKLDDLYFDVIFRDNTDKDLKKIEEKIKKFSAPINIKAKVDTKNINDALRKESITARIGKVAIDRNALANGIKDANKKNNTILKLNKVGLSLSALKQIQDDINKHKFKISNISVNTTTLESQISNAVRRAFSKNKASVGSDESIGESAVGNAINPLKSVFKKLTAAFVLDVVGKFIKDLTKSIGMFEQNLVALQTMLQSSSRGNTLFNQIKDFSTKSPFRFSELVGFTKQLTAFQVPYEEIFDTTKRLADLSAGLGVDMGRIILAYGQVRSAEFLRGQELRQFTEAGVPLLQLLADKFSILERRVVSTSEVFDYISKRKVPFAMVKDVLQDLTNEGGMFYNMQERQANTLAGRVKNLADAYDVLKYKIGESGVKNFFSSILSGVYTIMECKDAIITLGAALTAAFVTSGVIALSKAVLQFQSKIKALWTYMGGMWPGIVGAIAGAAMMIYNAYKEVENAKESFAQAADDLEQKVKTLSEIFKDTDFSINIKGEEKLETIKKTIDKINEIMPNGEANSLIASLLGDDKNIDETYGKVEDAIKKMERVQSIVKGLADSGFSAYGRSMLNIFKLDLPNALDEYSHWIKTINEDPSFNDLDKRLKDELSLDTYSGSPFYISQIELFDNIKIFENNLQKRLSSMLGDKKISQSEMNTIISNVVDNFNLSGNTSIVKIKAQLDLNPNGDIIERSSELTKVFLDNVESRTKKMGLSLSELLNDFQLSGYNRTSEAGKKVEEIFREAANEAKLSTHTFENELDQVREAFLSKPWDINLRLRINDYTQYGDQVKILRERLYDQKHGAGAYQQQLSYAVSIPVKELERDDLFKIPSAAISSTSSASQAFENLNNNLKQELNEEKRLKEELKKKPNDSKVLNMLDKTRTNIKAYRNAMSVMGFTPETDKSDNSNKPSKEDALLKSERERYDLLKKYVQEYERLVKLYGQEKAAKDVAKEIDFSTVLNDKDFIKAMGGKIDASDPVALYQKYLSYLEKNLKGGGDRSKFVDDVRIAGAKVQRDKDAKELSDSFDMLNNEIEKNTKRWEVYTKMLNLTGNEETAKIFAFGSPIPFSKQSEQLKNTIEGKYLNGQPVERFKDMGENKLIQQFGEGPAKLIQQYFKMLDSEQTSALNDLITGLEKSIDLQTTLDGINNKYDKLISSAKDNGFGQKDIDNLNVQRNEELAKSQWNFFKKTPEYTQMFEDLSRIGTKSLDSLYSTFLEMSPQVKEDSASLKELINALKKIREELEKRNPFKTISNSIKDASYVRGLKLTDGLYTITTERDEKLFGKRKGETVSQDEVNSKGIDLMKSLSNGISGAVNGFKALESILDPVVKLFEQLGDTSLSDALNLVNNALSTISSTQNGMNTLSSMFDGMGAAGVTKAVGAASPYLSAAMAGVSVVTSLFALHDKALQKHIEMLKREEKKAQSVYELIEKRLKYTLGKGYGMDSLKGYTEGTTYRSQRENLMSQYYLKQQQLADEMDKKKKDESTINDLRSDIDTMKETILQYSEELANNLFGLNLEEWAKNIGDALIDAFAEGTSAADAFNDSVADIIKNVVKNMAQLYIIEPAMKDLQNYLFGSDGTGGVFGKDLTFSREDLMGMIPILANLKTSIGNVKDLYDAIKEVASQNGIDLSGKSSGLSAGIQNITEDTADLLASYINAIRARLMLQGALLDEKLPLLQEINELQLRELQNITINTMRNAEAAEHIEDAIVSLTTIGSNGKQLKVKAY